MAWFHRRGRGGSVAGLDSLDGPLNVVDEFKHAFSSAVKVCVCLWCV